MEEVAHRFWTKVRFGPDCWIWLGAIQKGDMEYGLFKVKGRNIHAHRVSFILSWGPIPKGMLVRHTCDTPLCVKPDHLIAGTHQQKMDDRNSRGRHAHGARQGLAKLDRRYRPGGPPALRHRQVQTEGFGRSVRSQPDDHGQGPERHAVVACEGPGGGRWLEPGVISSN